MNESFQTNDLLNSKYENPVWQASSSDLDSQRKYSEAAADPYSFGIAATSPKLAPSSTTTSNKQLAQQINKDADDVRSEEDGSGGHQELIISDEEPDLQNYWS